MSCEESVASALGASDVLSTSLLFLASQETKIVQLTQEFNTKKAELQSNEELKASIADDFQRKMQLITQLKSTRDANEVTWQDRKVEADTLKRDVMKNDDLRRQFLVTLQNEAKRLAHQFVSAPQNYHISKISEEIATYTHQIEILEKKIQYEYEPEIAASVGCMENEPSAILKTPDSPPIDVTADVLTMLISKLKEDTQECNQLLDQLRQKKLELEQEESTY